MSLNLPVQTAVDRSEPLEIYLVARKITDRGNVVEILENPVGGPYGSLPGDPAGFAEGVDPRTDAYQLAARYAAARHRLGRYF